MTPSDGQINGVRHTFFPHLLRYTGFIQSSYFFCGGHKEISLWDINEIHKQNYHICKHLLMMTIGPERWSDEMSFVGGYEYADQMPSHLLLDFSEKTRQRARQQRGTGGKGSLSLRPLSEDQEKATKDLLRIRLFKKALNFLPTCISFYKMKHCTC